MITTAYKQIFFLLFSLSIATASLAQQWPQAQREAKPGTRWWWLGSAVDEENLQWNLQQYADKGIGAVEITPLYGVKGNSENNIPYLSDEWMKMLRFTQAEAERNGIEVDMATGTGWPFGGPWVPLEESACKAVFVEKDFTGKKLQQLDLTPTGKDSSGCVLHRVMLYNAQGEAADVTPFVSEGKLSLNVKEVGFRSSRQTPFHMVALYIKYGVMRVKRAAPGGEGLVVDHFDRTAVAHYLQHIEEAFERTHTPYPHTFFNDSYEVADATWTPTLLDEFERRRGYKLQNYFPLLLPKTQETFAANFGKTAEQVLSDYRETLSDLLLENFTEQWTAWAHRHGAITRNQAHGSPANLIDCYAAVDIPEIEGFGLSELGIKGLRRDPGKTRKNDSDFSMLKYAPSAAHITGKKFTSSETFTWLTEHFRTSLSQLKPDIDLMFCAGVNHMFFHGTCYSPKNDEWPGWKFYASIDMSPTNSIWRDAQYFMQYVERCQSFLQWGEPDNDFLVYLPIRDMWRKQPERLLMQFSIHQMGKLAPEFIESILEIDRAGFDCDYISERLLLSTTFHEGKLLTAAGTPYKGLIIPDENTLMSDKVRAHIQHLQQLGAPIIYGTDSAALSRAARPEPMKTLCSLKLIRRRNPQGYHYFIANLTPNDISQTVPLAVRAVKATWFNPLNGETSPAILTPQGVEVCLRSGESMILKVESQKEEASLGELITHEQKTEQKKASTSSQEEYVVAGPWQLSFTEESPRVEQTFTLDSIQTWENLNAQTRITMGTGVYTAKFNLTEAQVQGNSWIDLGDVRESARVYINGELIGCAWAVPFVLNTHNTLKPGNNEVRIEVTNLPANRISELDRRQVPWRKMEEINVVDINYKKTTYADWQPVASGIAGPVKLIFSKTAMH